MKLSVGELNVIWATLNESTSILDKYGNIFMYDKRTRKQIAEKIFNYVSKIQVDIEEEDSTIKL